MERQTLEGTLDIDLARVWEATYSSAMVSFMFEYHNKRAEWLDHGTEEGRLAALSEDAAEIADLSVEALVRQ
jgi:hypothetical protein